MGTLSTALPYSYNQGKVYGISESFAKKGYIHLREEMPSQTQFRFFYKDIDVILDQIKCDRYLRMKNEEAQNVWLAQTKSKGFWGEMGLEYHFEETEPQRHKDEFMVTVDFIHFFEQYYENIYSGFPALKTVHRQIMWIDDIIARQFRGLLYSLEKNYNGINERIAGFSHNLPIAYRVIRYHSSESYASALHYDKSLMSILIHDTDSEKETKQVLCPYKKNLSLNDLKPIRIRKNGNRTSAIVIPGLGMEAIGVNIMPTPHAVLPFTKHGCFRYAFVAYLMVPYTHISPTTSKVLFYEKNRLGVSN
jgi:hypothetical protein